MTRIRFLGVIVVSLAVLISLRGSTWPEWASFLAILGVGQILALSAFARLRDADLLSMTTLIFGGALFVVSFLPFVGPGTWYVPATTVAYTVWALSFASLFAFPSRQRPLFESNKRTIVV